jgi:hypothetical protein
MNISLETIEEVMKMREEGMSVYSIAKALNVDFVLLTKKVKSIETDRKSGLVDTETAAQMLHRATQTLRKWNCKGGPIQAVPFSRKAPLLWRISDIKKLLEEETIHE